MSSELRPLRSGTTVLMTVALSLMMMVMASVAGAASPRSSHRCAQAQGKTIAANAVARVYRRSRGAGTYVCALPGGRSYSLGDADAFPDIAVVGPVSIAGDYVAYGLAVTDRTGSANSVNVIRVKHSGRGRSLPVDDEQNGDVGSVVVTSAGATAWTVARADGSKRVWVAAPGVRATPVATSTGIDVSSLALGVRRIFWMQDGVPQTSVL